MRIAHLSAEVAPFAKAGGLGDVVGSLPVAQAKLGHEVSVWMPLHRQAREELARRGLVADRLGSYGIVSGPLHLEVGLLRAELPGSKVPVFFVEADRFFNRPHVYGLSADGRDDGLLRFGCFVRGALEGMRRYGLVPEVLNAHDWHAALAPMILAWERPAAFAGTVTVLTIHNLAYQGVYDIQDSGLVDVPLHRLPAVAWRGALNLLKGGILTARLLTTVSPTFAWEITTPEGGFELDPILRYRASDLTGIINGIDTEVWSPSSDLLIPRHYGQGSLDGKVAAREELLRLAKMDPADPGLVIGMIGRLTPQKGYELLLPALDELIGEGIRFVLLGSGDPPIEKRLREVAERSPGKAWAHLGFDDPLAHLIEAGADAFLMPSIFEPCGLNQLYSLAYGTVPIVRRVGGLADTVVPFDGTNAEVATGFSFREVSPQALREAVRLAARAHRDPALWSLLVRNGMGQDFSWQRSAERYLEVYRRAVRAGAERTPAAFADQPIAG
jgi:starch synthase